MMMANNELKPCPFCGSHAVEEASCNSDGMLIRCVNCYADGPVERTRAKADSSWNRRATPAQGALTDAQSGKLSAVAIHEIWHKVTSSHVGENTPFVTFARAIEQRVRGQVSDAADAAAELSDLDQENLRVGRELQRAAGFLPDDYNIEVNIERGYGSAALFGIDGTCVATFDAGDSDGMSYAIGKAIDAAIQAQAGDAA